MTIYVWDPQSGYEKGTAKHITTQGFKPTNHPLTLTTQGFLIPAFVTAEINLLTGGSASVSATTGGVVEFNYEPEGGLVTGGEAPYIIDIDGNTVYEWASEGSEIDGGPEFAGHSLVTTVLDGDTVYEYEPTGGLNTSGDAPYIIDSEGRIVYVYASTGSEDGIGPIFGGGATIEFIPGSGFVVKEHGGRGVLPWTRKRERMGTSHTFVWYAPLLRRFALKLRGAADTEFISGEPYPFLKSLPVLPKEPEPNLDFYKALQAYSKKTATLPSEYTEDSHAPPLTLHGAATVEFSPAEQRAYSEDELILLLLDDDAPIILSTTFDS